MLGMLATYYTSFWRLFLRSKRFLLHTYIKIRIKHNIAKPAVPIPIMNSGEFLKDMGESGVDVDDNGSVDGTPV